jgi:phospholipid/cholesterol/gamma-HCH transport system substrate-binding protein
MKKSKLELLAGVFVLLGLAAVAYLTIKLGSGEFIGGASYVVEARFANAGGLSSGSTVQLAGVQVGRVDDIRMDPADYSAIATLRIVNEVKLPTDTMASIKTTGLIGDKFVALAPGADETELDAGSRIIMTESAVDLESLIGRMAFGKVKDDAPADSSEETSP